MSATTAPMPQSVAQQGRQHAAPPAQPNGRIPGEGRCVYSGADPRGDASTRPCPSRAALAQPAGSPSAAIEAAAGADDREPVTDEAGITLQRGGYDYFISRDRLRSADQVLAMVEHVAHKRQVAFTLDPRTLCFAQHGVVTEDQPYGETDE